MIAAFLQTLVLPLTVTSPAAADEGAEARARALVDEAARLRSSGEAASACARLEESDRLAPSEATEHLLADCYETIGKTASAWTAFNALATRLGSVGKNDEARAARSRAAAIEPRLAKLRVVVSPPVDDLPGLRILRDGLSVGKAAFGIPLPVDPGPHVIKAGAARHLPWEKTLEVPSGPVVIEVQVPQLDLDRSLDDDGDDLTDRSAGSPFPFDPGKPGSPSPDHPRAGAPAGRLPPAPRPVRLGRPKLQRDAAFILGGVGLGGAALGVITGGLALARGAQWRSYSGEHCNAALACDRQSSVDVLRRIEHDRAAFATLANIGLVGGVSALGGAAILWFTPGPIGTSKPPPKARKVEKALWISPFAGAGEAGASVGGQF